MSWWESDMWTSYLRDLQDVWGLLYIYFTPIKESLPMNGHYLHVRVGHMMVWIIFTWSGLADVGMDISYTILFKYNICMPGVGGCLVFCWWRCSAAARLPARGGAELRLWRQLRRSVCQEPAARQDVTQWRFWRSSDGDAQHEEDAGAGRRAGPPVGHGNNTSPSASEAKNLFIGDSSYALKIQPNMAILCLKS